MRVKGLQSASRASGSCPVPLSRGSFSIELAPFRAQCVAPYLSAAVQQSSVAGLVKAFLHKCNADAGSSDEEEDDGVDLCNCEFSLAYGGYSLILSLTLTITVTTTVTLDPHPTFTLYLTLHTSL